MSDDPPDGPSNNGPWGSGPSLSDIASAGIDKARAFLAARNPDAAIREAETVFSRDPNGRWGYLALDVIADARAEKSDYKAVEQIGRELLSIDPERIEGYYHLARGAMDRDDMRTCIDALERGLSRHPQSIALTILNAVRFRRCQDTKRALEWAEKGAALAPWHPGALHTLGFALKDADRHEDAQRAFEEARALDPGAASAARVAALVAFADNRFEEALKLAHDALAIDPQDDDCRHIIYRARVFKNPVMTPYWRLHQLSTKQALVGSGCLLLLAAILSPLGLGRFVFPALAIYYLVCMFIVLLVQALDGPKRVRKAPTLKNY